MATSANAENFWIPAEKLKYHFDGSMEGSQSVDQTTGKAVYLLGNGQQVSIKIGINDALSKYLRERPNFKVCARVANYDSGVTTTLLSKHPNFGKSKLNILGKDRYQLLCSERGRINNKKLFVGGLKVMPSSQGLVKLRGISIRGLPIRVARLRVLSSSSAPPRSDIPQSTVSALANYESSRAMGYIWADGGVSSDGKSLHFRKDNGILSKHFASLAQSAFGAELKQNAQSNRYVVKPDSVSPAQFLGRGPGLSKISDKRAFLTSIVEAEGAVSVARVLDDPSRSRCGFVRDLVNDMNPQCAVSACTDGSCATPNCAFIAHGKYRGIPDNPSKNTHCAVYLTGNDTDWRSLFGSAKYHFVKTDRTPGGEPKKHSITSRPNYTK